jgi:hypothetical protein
MSQRPSGYARHERDVYETPGWVTATLLAEGLREPAGVWEPAAGSGKMLRVLQLLLPIRVVGSDVHTGQDFLASVLPSGCDCIVTNPPYKLGPEFIRHALSLLQPVGGQLALLLRTDFDHARTRADLFAGCPAFSKKLVLTKRIRWFEDERTASPSFNHCWMLWDWQHRGPPTIAYGPKR